MTDGGLDDTGNPGYPQPDWLPAAHHAVNIQLGAARAARAEIWPLGFGDISAENAAYLQYLASQGSQTACDSRPISRPRAIVAQDSARALNALYTLYAAASCSGLSNGRSAIVSGGQSRVLTVNIPPIASDGAISVNKGNPGIRVDYMTPGGTEVTGGSLPGSTFVRSGQDTSVEVLHITDPQAGTWKVQVTAPPGQTSQLVSVTAFWQGAVRVSLLTSPPTAQPGQRIGVILSVLGVNGPITDPALLSGMRVGLSVTGDGLPGSVAVPLHPGGTASSGLSAGDFGGTFTAPSITGNLTFTGLAVGYGLYATVVPAAVRVTNTATVLEGTVQFNAPSTVQSGQALPGQVLFNNKTGRTQHVRLTLTALPALATITVPAGVLTVPSGTSTVPFTIMLAPDTPVGPTSLVVRVVDAGHPAISYGNQQLLINVRHPPGVLGKYRWEIGGAVALLLLIALALYLRRVERRHQIDVRDLLISLSRDGTAVGPELRAPGKQSDTFRFMIRGESGTDPRLDYPQQGDRPYAARRITHGKVRVRASDRVKVAAPDGGSYKIALGGVGERLPDGTDLSIREKRHDKTRTPRSRRGPDRTAPAPEPTPPSQPTYNVWD